MLCYESENRLKAIKAKNLWESHLGKDFDIKVNDRSTLMLVKSDKRWRVIELDCPDFLIRLDAFLLEMQDFVKNQEKQRT